MISLTFRGCASGLTLVALIASAGWAAEQPRTQSGKAIQPAQRPSTTKAKSGARGPLPDPVLLDGSTQAPEKKSEYGMIGDFELPGDENARKDRVGGQGGGQQQQQGQGGGGLPMGLPQAGGAGGQQQAQQTAKAGGAGQQGEQQGGQQNPNAAGEPVPGAGDANAKPEGIQVAQLGGEASGETPPNGEKPQSVAIGDSAMQIKPSANAPGVVGGQQLPQTNTQQHEKGTGSGGKGPTGTQGPNRIEKGRSIPAGL